MLWYGIVLLVKSAYNSAITKSILHGEYGGHIRIDVGNTICIDAISVAKRIY
jgi:hypothetical protein